jgi:hypothetical protein
MFNCRSSRKIAVDNDITNCKCSLYFATMLEILTNCLDVLKFMCGWKKLGRNKISIRRMFRFTSGYITPWGRGRRQGKFLMWKLNKICTVSLTSRCLTPGLIRRIFNNINVTKPVEVSQHFVTQAFAALKFDRKWVNTLSKNLNIRGIS